MHQNPKKPVTKQLRQIPNLQQEILNQRKVITSSLLYFLVAFSVLYLIDIYIQEPTAIPKFLQIFICSLLIGAGAYVDKDIENHSKFRIGTILILDMDQAVVQKTKLRSYLLELVRELKELQNLQNGSDENMLEYNLKQRIRGLQFDINNLTKLQKPAYTDFEVVSHSFEKNPISLKDDVRLKLVRIKRGEASEEISIFVGDYLNNNAWFQKSHRKRFVLKDEGFKRMT